MTQRPKEKDIVIKEVSNINSDRPVTRSPIVLEVDMSDKGKNDSTPQPVITSLDPLFKGKSSFRVDEIIEEEVDDSHVTKKRKNLIGSD